jgi:hypothetical protein
MASVSGAMAVPFTWDPSAVVPGADGAFTATNGTVADYATVNVSPGGAFTESGLINFAQFTNNGTSLALPGLNQNYALYVDFNATGTQNSGSVLPGTNGTITGTFSSLTYSLIAAAGKPTFSASTGGPAVAGVSNGVTVATGSLISGTSAITDTDLAGLSAAANVLTTFTPTNSSFFLAPTSTLGLQFFTSVNNTGSVLAASGSELVINGGGGNATLQQTAVPEPASMAVLGAGLLGLGMVRRRKAK